MTSSWFLLLVVSSGFFCENSIDDEAVQQNAKVLPQLLKEYEVEDLVGMRRIAAGARPWAQIVSLIH